MAPRHHPRVIVTDGRETGVRFAEPGENAFRAGVALTNEYAQEAANVADAFELACSKPYMGKALGVVLPHGWRGVVQDAVDGLKSNILWMVTGAGIGAAFGAAIGLLMPPAEPFTAAAGASLGMAIATYAMIGTGLWAMGKMFVSITPIAIDCIAGGFRAALDGQIEKGAMLFAQGIALVFGAIVPLIVIAALTKGAGKILNARTSSYMLGNLQRRIAASRIINSDMARTVGLGPEEWQALAQSTRGMIQVFRGCNPARLAAMERAGGMENVHFKPAYLNAFKSAKAGPKIGEYVIDQAEFEQYLGKKYVLEQKSGNTYIIKSTESGGHTKVMMHSSDPLGEGASWLDGHLAVRETFNGKPSYLIKHPDGKAFVPDIDRLFYAEIKSTGSLGKSGVIKGKKWLANDDPREVMHWNQMISESLSKMLGKPIDWRGFQHGKSGDYLKIHEPTGELGPAWPKRNVQGAYLIDNEQIVIGVDGHLFATDWVGLATYCKSLELLNFKYPWAKAIIK